MPVCKWCIVDHLCPDECGGGPSCPYAELARIESKREVVCYCIQTDGPVCDDCPALYRMGGP